MRKFLEALQYFVVHNITWTGSAGKVWALEQHLEAVLALELVRDFRSFLRRAGGMSETAHLVQMFDSTIVRAHVSSAGAKGGSMVMRSVARVAASRSRFSVACELPFK